MIQQAAQFLESLLFIKVFGFPFIVLWLAGIGIFMTVKLRFINITLLGHAFALITGKFKTEKELSGGSKNEIVSPIGAFMSSLAATIGLGNIAGTAIAITLGGPGAILWMVIFGFFGMTVKCAEVFLGHKYRIIGKDGQISGGGFYYLDIGLKECGFPKLGKILAYSFAIFAIIGTAGVGGFQANQIVAMAMGGVDLARGLDHNNLVGIIISACLATLILYILLGGIKRLAKFAETLVPFKITLYIGCVLIVLAFQYHNIIPAIKTICHDAFDFSSGFAGFVGVLVVGARRAVFACEAGQGTAPIVNANSSLKKSEQQGIINLLDPAICTWFVCFLTGLCIVSTGVYQTSSADGILLTRQAFNTVSPWLGYILTACAFVYAFTTAMTDSYYCEKSVMYIFKNVKRWMIISLYALFIFIAGIVNLHTIVAFADLFVLLMTIPNVIGMYFMSGKIAASFKKYTKDLKIQKNA